MMVKCESKSYTTLIYIFQDNAGNNSNPEKNDRVKNFKSEF